MNFLQILEISIKSIPTGGFFYDYHTESIKTLTSSHKVLDPSFFLKRRTIYFNYSDFIFVKNLKLKERILYLLLLKIKRYPERAIDALSIINNNSTRYELRQVLLRQNKIKVLLSI